MLRGCGSRKGVCCGYNKRCFDWDRRQRAERFRGQTMHEGPPQRLITVVHNEYRCGAYGGMSCRAARVMAVGPVTVLRLILSAAEAQIGVVAQRKRAARQPTTVGEQEATRRAVLAGGRHRDRPLALLGTELLGVRLRRPDSHSLAAIGVRRAGDDEAARLPLPWARSSWCRRQARLPASSNSR